MITITEIAVYGTPNGSSSTRHSVKYVSYNTTEDELKLLISNVMTRDDPIEDLVQLDYNLEEGYATLMVHVDYMVTRKKIIPNGFFTEEEEVRLTEILHEVRIMLEQLGTAPKS